jgi:alkylation response protein AidB-like acyl-CoA dehydrogenase
MDFRFTEEQESLQSTAREFLANECPMALVREISESEPRGWRPSVWEKMAGLGWMGLLIPEEYGGAGLGFVDLALILEEMGRALLPSPFFGNLQGTLAVLHAGSETQRKEILPAVAEGRKILTFAITEGAGTEEIEEIGTRAEKSRGGYRLTGTKLFVPHAQSADRMVVVARSGTEGEAGISLFLVDAKERGVEITARGVSFATGRLRLSRSRRLGVAPRCSRTR